MPSTPASMFILDTDIVSMLSRERQPVALGQWLDEIGAENLCLCYPVVAELMRGAHLLVQSNPSKAGSIFGWFEDLLGAGFSVLEMSFDVAEVYAMMTSLPRYRHLWTVDRSAKHSRLGHDLQIAALSIVYQIPILTGNGRDYEEINDVFPLPGVYLPLKGYWCVPPARIIELPPLTVMADADTSNP